MKVEELLDAARQRCGLSDFGDGAFAEGLEALVASLDGEAQLNEIGRAALPEQIATNLANRLRVVDWLTRHPELAGAALERPIFILGMPRTGTTLLSHLLAQDPQLRSLMAWEAQSSVPPPEAATFGSDPRIAAAEQSGRLLDALNPGFKAIHYDAPDGPTECVAVLAQDFKSILWETVANVPSYAAWLRECDYGSAYRYHRRVLQLLQSRAPGRWSLKSPGHRLALDALLAVHPDASFVVTHRDPVKVVASTCSLVHSLSGTFSDADHRSYIARHWTEVLDDMVRRVEEHRHRDPGRFLDLDYAALVADPIGTVRRVYRHVGAELTPGVEAAMARYLAGNPAGKYGRHGYALADLGLDRGELEERFSAYVERYEIARESVA